MVGPAVVLKSWKTSGVKLAIDGKNINPGKNFRYGVENDTKGNPQSKSRVVALSDSIPEIIIRTFPGTTSFIISFMVASSFITVNFQGWMFLPLGALMPHFNIKSSC